MHMLFPVHAVVSSNVELARAYNLHLESHSIASSCMSPSEAQGLLDRGAAVESIYLVKDCSTGFIDRLAQGGNAPQVYRLAVEPAAPGAIEEIHKSIRKKLAEAGMG